MDSYVIDKRILHVPNIYSEYENMSPAEIMIQAHDRIRDRFFRIAEGKAGVGAGSYEEAKILNEFFQALKEYQRNPNTNMVNSMQKQIISNVLSRARNIWGHGKTYFFGPAQSVKEQGAQAEQELATIMEAVFKEVSGGLSTGTAKDFMLGTSTVNVIKNGELNPAAIDKIAQTMAREGAKKVYNKIMSDNKDNRFTAVQGKIDVSGANATVVISANASPYLIQIATLLNKASFSVKSYSSLGQYSEDARARLESKITKLHLGKTNKKRIFEDIFGQLGIPNKVATSMLYYSQKTKNQKVKTAASRLQFIYELTGYGQKYVNNAIQEVLNELGIAGANYFLYNDPATNNIYVASTAWLIQEMWDQVDDIIMKKSTDLSKSIAAVSYNY